MKRTLENEIAF